MKKRLLFIFFAISSGLLTIIISGCTSNRVDLVNTERVSLDRLHSQKVYILWSGAYEDEDGFFVNGVIRRRDYSSSPFKAHVDVTIVGPDEMILHEAYMKNVYVPKRSPGKGIGWERFTVRFTEIPPKGSKIRVVAHSDIHSELGIAD